MSYIVNSTGYTAGALKNDNGVLQDLNVLETMVAPSTVHGINIMQDAVGSGASATRVLTVGADVDNANGGLYDVVPHAHVANTHYIKINYKGDNYWLGCVAVEPA
jgi:hypothetical protein